MSDTPISEEVIRAAPRLTVAGLKKVVTDPSERKKGTQVYDAGGLEHLARYGSRIYGQAKGSGKSPYKVSITWDDAGQAKGRCSCFAARTRPFCKHAAALLVAWARQPESFAASAGPPPEAAPRRSRVKRGRKKTKELLGRGVEQAATLVGELGVAGVASLTGDRIEQIRDLAQSLRGHRLRRLSARTLELADLLAGGTGSADALEPLAYADLLADMLLTVRKLEKHLGGSGRPGEKLDDRYVEELIGRTWHKKDRAAVSDLKLLEYAYVAGTTSDDFVIRESRLIDVKTGVHYSEKQILPAFLARRQAPKASWVGQLLDGATGGLYPGFPPRRLDLGSPGEPRAIRPADLEALLAAALPGVAEALAGFQQHRRDVFAPSRYPVAFRVERLAAHRGRLRAVDASGAAMYLRRDPGLEEVLATALAGGPLRAFLGDVDLDGVVPALRPLAAVVEGRSGLEMRAVAGAELEEVEARPAGLAAWLDDARAAGLSAVAISIGEVRGELADALVAGLAGLTERTAEPLVARLEGFDLAKQAALLARVAASADPAARLNDFVKLYKVLEVALVRLAAAGTVDLEGLVPVATIPSVFVAEPEEIQPPAEVARRLAAGRMGRFEAGLHYGRWYGELTDDELVAAIYPAWADGGAAEYVARVFAERPAEALAAAEWVLAADRGLMARLTAVQVLAGAGTPAARDLLARLASKDDSPAVRCRARQAQLALDGRVWKQDRTFGPLLDRLENAGRLDDRAKAAQKLEELGDPASIPNLRRARRTDVSWKVRKTATRALSRLGDADLVPALVGDLGGYAGFREEEERVEAARTLGGLGDARGVPELLALWRAGWKPGVLGEALRAAGHTVLEPLLDLLDEEPALARRKVVESIFEALDPDAAAAALAARVEGLDGSQVVSRVKRYLKLASFTLGGLPAVSAAAVALADTLADTLDGQVAERVRQLAAEAGKKKRKKAKKTKKQPLKAPVAPSPSPATKPGILSRLFGRR